MKQPATQAESATSEKAWPRLAQNVATIGFVLYAAFAPHSIAAAEISLAIVGAGWLVRTLAAGRTGFHRSVFDLPIWLFFLWTVASSLLSQEPRISLAKIQSTCVVFLFYLAHAVITRRTAVLLVALMILSAVAGTIYSVYDLVRGRGVVVELVAPDSPLQPLHIGAGDAIWRIGGRRVDTVTDIDELIRNSPDQSKLTVSVISQGEHLERSGLVVTDQIKRRQSPSGIVGSRPTHRFRASGWTRHYETYSEILQMLAQLALGLALANFKNHGLNLRGKLAAAAFALLALGITLTAMRTVMIALVFGVCVISLRASGRRAKVLSLAGICFILALGALVVYRTRAQHALLLQDPSSALRVEVARVGLSRLWLHPVFGHGMDAVHVHWTEWGFPGTDMLHLHSTPLQLAFDRGLPALAFWLWIVWLFWRTATRGEKSLRDSSDTNRYGILLGATGAVAGFFASSMVNYNFGDGEVALLFWWLLGIVLVLTREKPDEELHTGW
jgi:O-Antigen ligase/PDZ domain